MTSEQDKLLAVLQAAIKQDREEATLPHSKLVTFSVSFGSSMLAVLTTVLFLHAHYLATRRHLEIEAPHFNEILELHETRIDHLERFEWEFRHVPACRRMEK